MKFFILTLTLLLSCSNKDISCISSSEFTDLMNQVSNGWNTNNAKRAADCFTLDAVYIEPPDRQLYISRDSLFKFFGGESGRTNPMKMTWHYLLFDESQQIGTAEYTFQYKGRSTHGLLIVKITDGKIFRWREYQYRSKTDWIDFIGKSAF